MSHRLIADDLGHRFGRRGLFRHLSFVVEPGERVAVTGPNGSGKSTLLRILAGVLRPTEGTVTLVADGSEVDPETRPLQTGLVAPYLNVYDGFTTRENLRFLAQARRLQGADAHIQDLVDLVGLTDRADDLVQTYSSGMKQRVKVAAALLGQPVLLLLDEPSTNLDAAGLRMIDRVTAHHIDRGGLLLVATNDAAEAARCNRAISVEPPAPR